MTLTQNVKTKNMKAILKKVKTFYPLNQVFVHAEGNISFQRQWQTFKQRTGIDSFVPQPKIFIIAEKKGVGNKKYKTYLKKKFMLNEHNPRTERLTGNLVDYKEMVFLSIDDTKSY